MSRLFFFQPSGQMGSKSSAPRPVPAAVPSLPRLPEPAVAVALRTRLCDSAIQVAISAIQSILTNGLETGTRNLLLVTLGEVPQDCAATPDGQALIGLFNQLLVFDQNRQTYDESCVN